MLQRKESRTLSATGDIERANLKRGFERLQLLLGAHGFVYYPGDQSVSSGGPFATGHFRRGEFEIGLIVRNNDQLGCPNYSEGHGYAGHDDLFWALGRQGEAQLVPGEFVSYIAKDGGDSFTALEYDLKHVILPALERSPTEFSGAFARAHKKFQDSLSAAISANKEI